MSKMWADLRAVCVEPGRGLFLLGLASLVRYLHFNQSKMGSHCGVLS